MSEGMPSHLKHKFLRVVGELNSLLVELRRTVPDANYYLDGGGGLHIMNGESHDERQRPRQDRILATAHLARAGGGDW